MDATTVYSDVRILIGDEIPNYKVNDIKYFNHSAKYSIVIQVALPTGETVVLQAAATNTSDAVKSLIADYNKQISAEGISKRKSFRQYIPVTYFI